MITRTWVVLAIGTVVFFGLGLAESRAQEAANWWEPVVRSASGERPAAAQRPGKGGPSGRGTRGPTPSREASNEGRRGGHVPKGHRPPPGQCRVWYPGQPPGQQPAPTSCRTAYRQRQGAAVVVTHHGVVRRPAPRWRSRPAGDVVFRRRPEERRRDDGGVYVDVEIIIDMLGRTGYRHLQEERRRLGIDGAITGRWVSDDRSESGVLQVRVGAHPLAELVDRTGDGQVNDFYVRR